MDTHENARRVLTYWPARPDPDVPYWPDGRPRCWLPGEALERMKGGS
jgi:hypothetical protein